MRRYGFGEVTGETEKGGRKQYADGHVEISEKAARFATQEHPQESPAGAVALELARVGGVDLADHVVPTVDREALLAALEGVDGIGEETAADALEAVAEALGAGDDA